MSALEKAAQQALEALDCIYSPLYVREINKVGAAMNALRAALAQAEAVRESEQSALNRAPLDDAQALALARQHLDKGLSRAPHIVRCTDLEVRALIRAVEAAHGIGA